MEIIELYNKEFCKILYNKNLNFIKIQWFGFPRSSDFRESCLRVIDFMKEYNTGKLLTDNRNAKVFSVDDQKWLNNEWLPIAIDAGYFCSATLISDDVFVKTAIKSITDKRDNNKVKTKMFINEDEAINWLESV